MNQQFGNQGFQQGVSNQQLNRIHENSVFAGSSQGQASFPQAQRIQQNTIFGNEANPLGAGFGGGFTNQAFGGQQGFQNQAAQFGQQGFQQGVSQAQVDRIHQNSLFNGASQFDTPQAQRIHQNSIFNGASGGNPAQAAQALNAGFGGGFTNQAFGGQQGFQNQAAQFGGQQGFQNQAAQFGQQGFQQGVPQAQIDRIHQNSLFNGASQFDTPQAQRIHQNSIFNGASGGNQAEAAQALNAGFGGAFSNQAFGGPQGFQNQAAQFGGQQGFQNQAAQFGQQGFQQGVPQAQIDRIHQNSLFNGASQFDTPQAQRIHQNSIFNGASGGNPAQAAQALNAGFGGAFSNQAFGGPQGFQNQAAQFGQQGFQQGVSQAQVDRIHQNSLFNGASQFDTPQAQRIHQNSIFNGASGGNQAQAAQALNAGFGGAFTNQAFGGPQGFQNQAAQFGQQQLNGSAFRQVMSADAGIRDAEGPSQYPASMFTGRNQYDNVNQGAFNQVMNPQF